jgi:germination protein M
VEVTLFFSDEQAEYLVGEPRKVPRADGPSALAQAVVGELIRGPRTGGLQATMPSGTKLRKPVSCQDGTCTVDFSEEFVSNHPGGSSGELMTIYSVVESLTANVPGTRSVHFLVEGRPRDTLAGHMAIQAPVRADARYVRKSGGKDGGQKP